jgi:hypothetical protein
MSFQASVTQPVIFSNVPVAEATAVGSAYALPTGPLFGMMPDLFARA